MRALLLSIVLLAPAGVASANDASGDKQPEPAPPPAVRIDPPAKKPRPIAIQDSIRDPHGEGRSCEKNAMGQLECKASALAQ